MSVLKVTELTNYIRKYLKLDYFLNDLSVCGEVSNFTRHTSENLFFSLKDEESKIDCFMSSVEACELSEFPEDGDLIEVNGAVTISEKSSRISFVVKSFKLKGNGDLQKKFDKLVEKLNKEGYFDPTLKKKLVDFPNIIGVVTSPTGAAIRDILNVLKRRNKNVNVIIYPSLVQGDSAASTIIEGLKYLDTLSLDAIILARGGGSKEDLFVFNDELIARTIYEMNTPVISAVGHEIDFTIADFVSDLRAPTPSAAAELVTVELSDIILELDKFSLDLKGIINKILEKNESTIRNLRSNLVSTRPSLKIMKNDAILKNLRIRIKNNAINRSIKNRIHLKELLNRKNIAISRLFNRNEILTENFISSFIKYEARIKREDIYLNSLSERLKSSLRTKEKKLQELNFLKIRINISIRNQLKKDIFGFNVLKKRLYRENTLKLLDLNNSYIEVYKKELLRQIIRLFKKSRDELDFIDKKIDHLDFISSLNDKEVSLDEYIEDIKFYINVIISKENLTLTRLKSRLDICFKKKSGLFYNGEELTSIKKVNIGSKIKSILEDGILIMEVKNIEKVGKMNG